MISLAISTAVGDAQAQALYKYRGSDGEWIYTDRRPTDRQAAEIRELQKGQGEPRVTVTERAYDRQVGLIAQNDFYSPVEVIVALDELHNVGMPPPETEFRWVVPARSSAELLRLDAIDGGVSAGVSFRYVWLPGDPPDKPR
jgi:hypothetical protein